MRLLDRILSEGFTSLKPELDVRKTMEQLHAAQLVVIDNVATYHFQDFQKKLKEDQEMRISDFPNVMLPFEATFLEMRIKNNPSFQVTFEECGILAQMYKPEHINFDRIEQTQGGKMPPWVREALLHKDAVYNMIGMFFFYSRQIGKVLYAASFTMPVNAEGAIISPDDSFQIIGKVHMPNLSGGPVSEQDFLTYLARTYLHPCLLALSFMHCRNVKVVEEVPPKGLSKKHNKRHGRPLLRYRVLQIDPLKEVLESEGHVSTDGLKRALHICRGHFARYGKDGKGLLFGKHVATVWIPMHARGSQEEGVVLKDYEVVK